MNIYATVLAVTASLSFAIAGDDDPAWGSFRGNKGAGIATDTELPEALDKQANLVWRTEVPQGYSSPVIAGGDLFTTAAEGKKLITLCLDVYTGEIRWLKELEYDGKRVGANSAAAPTPTTDGESVFCLFHFIGMVAYDIDGEELWRNDLGAPFNIPHGLATSPVLHGDLVFVQVDQDAGSRLIALDKATGKERWAVERPVATHSYATPVIYEPEEGPAQVLVSGAYQFAAYSVKDGKKLWWMDGSSWQTKSLPLIHDGLCIINAYMVPSSEFGAPPLAGSWKAELEKRDKNGDGFLTRDEWVHDIMQQAWFIFDLDGDDKLNERDYEYLVSAGTATGGLFAIRLGGKGDVTKTHVAWKYDKRRGLSDVTSPVLVDGTIYMLKEGGIMTTIDASSGELLEQGRVGSPSPYFASPIAASNRLLTASQSGELAVLSCGAQGVWEVLSTNDLDEQIWATPALADGSVFIRSAAAIYCFAGAE